MFFAAGPVEAAVTNKALGFETTEEQGRTAGFGSFADTMDTLEYAVSGDGYIAGPNFTAADVYVGSQIGFGLLFGTIDKRPAFEDYWARISGRPAHQRATEIDDALMPEQQ